MDLSSLSTEDLQAIRAGNLGSVSTEGLQAIRGIAPAPKQPSIADRLLSSMAGRAVKGVNSVVEGGAEMLPYGLGVVSGLGGAAPNPVSKFFFDESRRVRQMNKDNEAVYAGAKERSGVTGTDYARMGGTVLGGAALGAALPAAPLSTASRAAFGFGVGGSSAALAPTGEVDDAQFANKKALQTLIGGGTGAVMTPAIGAIVDRGGPLIDKMINRFSGGPKLTEPQILERVRFQLGRENVDLNTFPPAARERVVKEVGDALKRGEKLDGAALLRKMDMDVFGGGTQGQITRDPAQWNREFNLRQVENAGEPLVDQAMKVRTETGQRLSAYGGSTTATPFEAGNSAMAALMGKDKPAKAAVDAAYAAARGADGRYAPINVQQFSKAANDALDEGQLGYVLPGPVKNLLNDVSTGKVPLNVNTSTQIESFLSGQARDLRTAGNRQGALAVDKVLGALRGADLIDDVATSMPSASSSMAPRNGMQIGMNDSPLLIGRESASREMVPYVAPPAAPAVPMQAREAFQAAKKLAAERFKTHDKIPGLKAALEGDIAPEKFVSKFVVGGDIKDVAELSKYMPEDGKKAIADQLAKHLERAAFGTNRTKDGVMAVERYNSTLDRLGKEKLSAFFPEEVVDDLYRIGRVNSYVSQQPAGITPNRSGTAGAIANLLQRIQGVPVAVPIIRGMVNQGRAASALSPNVPSDPIPVLTPALRNLLGTVPAGLGVVSE